MDPGADPFGLHRSGHCARQVPGDPPPPSCPIAGSGGGAGGSRPPNLAMGNPISPATGIKVQVETDYQGPDGLAFTRTYRSNIGYFASVAQGGWVDNTALGTVFHANMPGWLSSGGVASLKAMASGKQDYYLKTADGQHIEFQGSPNALTPKSPATRLSVARQTDAQGAAEWHVTREDGGEDVYDARGALISSATLAGLKTTYTYSDDSTPPEIAPKPGLLIAITSPAGRSLGLAYNAVGQMVSLTDPAGGVTRYSYDAYNNLTSVAYSDGTSRTYLYNESAYTAGANLPRALTGTRYATFRYNSTGQAFGTEHAGGADKYQFAYAGTPVTTATVTDPLGTARAHRFASVAGAQRETGVSQPGGVGCSAASDKITYDTNGNITSRKDFNGNTACYAYDTARNLETVRVEGLAPGKACPSNLAGYTPAANTAERKVATEWHTVWRLPTRVAEPGRLTTFNYDPDGSACGAKGARCGKTEQATLDATGGQGLAAALDTNTPPRAWAYDANGRVLSEDGPRTDANDTTTYAYDAQGNLVSVTDALGHATTYGDYDPQGRPRRITDPNGHMIELAYDLRGRLTSKAEDGQAATRYGYDQAGQLIRLDLPNGAYYTYRYDDAHRLTRISDAAGNQTATPSTRRATAPARTCTTRQAPWPRPIAACSTP